MKAIKSFAYAIAKRIVDLQFALIGLLLLGPAFMIVAGVSWVSRNGLQPVALVGQNGATFHSFTSDSPLIRRAFRLWDILLGHASLVGPRLLARVEPTFNSFSVRQMVTPGLFCLHWLRVRSNVAYMPEEVSDLEYVEKRGFWFDMSILLRAALVMLYGKPKTATTDKVQILGVSIDNVTLDGVLDRIDGAIEQATGGLQVAFVNSDCLNKAVHDRTYSEVLNEASLVLADGIGVKLAGSILSRPVRQNVNGTDLFPKLCNLLNRKRSRLYLLGARLDVVAKLADQVSLLYPGIEICGASDGYFTDEDRVVGDVAAAAPDVLLVAMGAPAQEIFIAKHRERLGAKVCIGVGGLFDFYSGRIPRAPQWLRDVGLEWSYRLYQEPRRMWRRYLIGNFVFLARVLADKYRSAFGTKTEATFG